MAKAASQPEQSPKRYWNAAFKGRVGKHERIRGSVKDAAETKIALDFDLSFEVDDLDDAGVWIRIARAYWEEDAGSLILEVFPREGGQPIISELAVGLSSAQAGWQLLMDDVFNEGTWIDWRTQYNSGGGPN